MYPTDEAVKGPFTPKITVIGVGGAGGNAVNNMIASKLDGVSFLAVNTDAQALENNLSPNILQLGKESTGGLGAGARPEIGRAAAEESLDDVMEQLKDQNMVFITAGMGGGTGTGAAPVLAKACKELDILTVGVVTKPFQFEGAQRMRQAEAGIEEMAQYVDTLIVIPNQNLFRIANEKTTFADAFKMADNVLQSGVRGVTDLMVVPGMINLDFADVRSATSEMGKAMMGTGEATGERRAIEAAEQAINNPLLDDISMKGARSVIINVAGGHDMTLFEIEEASNRITDEVDPDATIIFGSTFDDSLEGTLRITVVATGIEAEINRRAASRPMRVTAPTSYQQNKPVEEPKSEPVTDSFVARYPEPSRGNAVSSQPSAPAHNYAQEAPQTIEVPVVEEPQQNVAAASYHEPAVAQASSSQYNNAPQQQPTAFHERDNASQTEPAPTTGSVQTEYVTEGSAVRKVEVQPEESNPSAFGTGAIPPYAPAREERKEPESNLTLTPPSRPAAGHEEKKTPSLFERITGKKRDVEHEETGTTSSSASGNAGSMSSGLTAERKTVMTSYDTPDSKGSQGTLNIDSPSAPAKGNKPAADDLDIPAFLRRQIS